MKNTENSHTGAPARFSLVRVALVVLLSAGLAVPSLALARGQQNQGPKRTENLVKRADATVKTIREAEDQFRKTIGIYNSIMEGKSKDLRKSFSDLQKEIDNTQKKRADVRKRFDEMGQEADLVFASWHKEIETIASPELRDMSRTRMMETREKYSAIVMASTQAGSEVDTLFATLNDHILFLGYDLNDAGVASLAEEAAKLNEQATKILASIDETVSRLSEYIQATAS